MKRITQTSYDYPIIPGPVWNDVCEHGTECYVCSFEVVQHGCRGVRKYDLYVFPNRFYGEEVCIRYSNEGNCYVSPGSIGQFLARSGGHFNDEYSVASKILSELGRMSWEPRGEKQ